MSRVIIIGGGFAGLAAGVRLAERGGCVVNLYERRKHLGGRAYSFTDRRTGDTVDNGQHLFMKCYLRTRKFLETIGADDRLQFQKKFRLDFLHPGLGPAALEFPRLLPPPLNLLAGFMRYRPVNMGDVFRLRRVRAALATPLQSGVTVNDWLEECRQSPAIRQAFWDPLCISALNQHPDAAPARHLTSVLKLAFLGRSDSTLMGYPGVGLGAMYTDAARRFIHRHGGVCHVGEAATELRVVEDGKLWIRLKSGSAVTADAAICAVTPPALSRLLPEGFEDLKIRLNAYYPSPILSVNLWFAAPVLNRPFVGLLAGRMDWIFNKPMLYNGRDKASSGHVTLVASAAGSLVDQPDERLVEIALDDLHRFLPETRNIPLEHHLVVRERQATFALPLDHSPPPNRTAAPGLYIAGDWTDTGLPATVESAVESGYRAAAHTMEYLNANHVPDRCTFPNQP
ncbi:MAG: hydroxysqualene dehydroxylase HpnE [Candidatus Latescibacteria bacterium]|nr:hydroxysqualene dehydroxylase HpnE [Candidatus Latescibacterota bacterium]